MTYEKYAELLTRYISIKPEDQLSASEEYAYFEAQDENPSWQARFHNETGE